LIFGALQGSYGQEMSGKVRISGFRSQEKHEFEESQEKSGFQGPESGKVRIFVIF